MIEFNRIKRDYLIFNYNFKVVQQYKISCAWFKFYRPDLDNITYANLITNEEVHEIPKRDLFYKEKANTLERAQFVEMM